MADLPPWHPSSDRADAPADSFWAQLPRFEAMWESHVRRWPDKPSGADKAARADDPPGSWRGRGDQYLSPQRNAEAGKLISDLRRPAEEVTALLKQIEQDNPHGGVLVGLEHRIKGATRLKEKLVERAKHEIGTSFADMAFGIHDAVRYTVRFGDHDYVAGCLDVRQRLESAGCQMFYGKNHWLENPEYKGINTRWRTPAGDRFELQIHTSESFYAKEHLTHSSYDRLRAPDPNWQERTELEAYQRTVSSALAKPPGIERIPDRWEGS